MCRQAVRRFQEANNNNFTLIPLFWIFSAMNNSLDHIARLARRWAMRHRAKFNCDDDLAGMCAIASGYLHRLFYKAGIESYLCVNHEHCFVLANDHIVDITATQYGLKPVTIVKVEKAYQEFWFIEKKFKTPNDLFEYQFDEGWPFDQMVLVEDGM